MQSLKGWELLNNKYKIQNCINYDYNYVKKNMQRNKRLREMHPITDGVCIK